MDLCSSNLCCSRFSCILKGEKKQEEKGKMKYPAAPAQSLGFCCALYCLSHLCAFAGCPEVWQAYRHLPAAESCSPSSVLDLSPLWKPFLISSSGSSLFILHFYGPSLVSFLIHCNLLSVSSEITKWQSVCRICPVDIVWLTLLFFFFLIWISCQHLKREESHRNLGSGLHRKIVSNSTRLLCPWIKTGQCWAAAAAFRWVLPSTICACPLYSSSSCVCDSCSGFLRSHLTSQRLKVLGALLPSKVGWAEYVRRKLKPCHLPIEKLGKALLNN